MPFTTNQSDVMATGRTEVYKTLTVATKLDAYTKDPSRPVSTARNQSAHRKNLFATSDDKSRDARGCSQNDRGMLLSHRATSPLNAVNASNASNNEVLGLSKNTSDRRLGSAIHRVMFRTSTEQNLMTTRNRLDNRLEKVEPKSRVAAYQRRSNKSTNPTSSRAAKHESKPTLVMPTD